MNYFVAAIAGVGFYSISMYAYATGMYFSDNMLLSLALGTLSSCSLVCLKLAIDLQEKDMKK